MCLFCIGCGGCGKESFLEKMATAPTSPECELSHAQAEAGSEEDCSAQSEIDSAGLLGGKSQAKL